MKRKTLLLICGLLLVFATPIAAHTGENYSPAEFLVVRIGVVLMGISLISLILKVLREDDHRE